MGISACGMLRAFFTTDLYLITECFGYFQSLPFRCRFPGRFYIEKELVEERGCHNYTYGTNVPLDAVGGRNAERWEFPHVVRVL